MGSSIVKVGSIDVDRFNLPAPPAKRLSKYQETVDALVAHYGTPVVTRAQIVAFLSATYPNDTDYMRRIRWVTNARDKYRPAGPRTAYVLPFTTEERLAQVAATVVAEVPAPAITENVEVPTEAPVAETV